MKISEKQIAGLMAIAHEFKSDLIAAKARGSLTEEGQKLMSQICDLINQINRQQSHELKDIQ